MAISTDNVLDAVNMASFIGADPDSGYGTGFHILADGDTSVAREYGVFDLHADGVAAPATFILNKEGEVVAYHVGRDVTDRPTTEGVLLQLDQMAP